MEDYIDMIRVEGQKTLSFAKSEIKAEVTRDKEAELADVQQRLNEGIERTLLQEKEIEVRGDLIGRLSRQLKGFAGLYARTKPVVFVSQLLNVLDGSDEGMKRLIERWRENAGNRRRDREGSRVYVVIHRVKVRMRTFSWWRLYAATSSMAKETKERLSFLESEKCHKIEEIESEKKKLGDELEEVKQALAREQGQRMEILKGIQSMFRVKLDDIALEMTGVIEGTATTQALCLPRVCVLGQEEDKALVCRKKR